MMRATRAVGPAPASEVAPSTVNAAVNDALRSPGRPLDPDDRRRLETYFERDFSQVAVHTDQRAADSARRLEARAYTVGSHLVFGAGEYQPGSTSGQSLLAHELTHVLQQSGQPRDIGPDFAIEPAEALSEVQARVAAQGIQLGADRSSIHALVPAVGRVMRDTPGAAPEPAIPPAFSRAAKSLMPGELSLLSETLDNFGFDDDKLSAEQKATLDTLAGLLRPLVSKYPLATLSVVGHTDEVGSERYNRALGQRRSEAVRAYLARALPSLMISADSAGKSEPLFRTGKADGRNRRVEIRFSPGVPHEITGPLPVPPGPEPTPPPISIGIPHEHPSIDVPAEPHGGLDVGADAGTVTITLVYKDFNLPKSKEGARIDFLHEPSIGIQFSGGKAPDQVVQAAIAIINAHIRRHGEDLVEISLSPQAGVSTKTGEVSGGAQLQAELHVTTSFSFTVSSTVTAKKASIEWQPVMVGVLYHLELGKGKEKEKGGKPSLSVDETIGPIESQFDDSTLDDGAAVGNLKEGKDRLIEEMLTGMIAGAGNVSIRFDLDLGERPANRLPPRLYEGLLQLATLIKAAHPTMQTMREVQVPVYWQHPGSSERVADFFDLRLAP